LSDKSSRGLQRSKQDYIKGLNQTLHTYRGVNKTKVKTRSSAANINLTKPKFNSDPELTIQNLALAQQAHIYNASTANHNTNLGASHT